MWECMVNHTRGSFCLSHTQTITCIALHTWNLGHTRRHTCSVSRLDKEKEQSDVMKMSPDLSAHNWDASNCSPNLTSLNTLMDFISVSALAGHFFFPLWWGVKFFSPVSASFFSTCLVFVVTWCLMSPERKCVNLKQRTADWRCEQEKKKKSSYVLMSDVESNLTITVPKMQVYICSLKWMTNYHF